MVQADRQPTRLNLLIRNRCEKKDETHFHTLFGNIIWMLDGVRGNFDSDGMADIWP